ncbi:SPOR domain-containing protein [Rothia sp. 27098_8_161]|nr:MULTISPECIES: SPOR domain-containing protein [unclassified Rothia (in: high G+C Gram-positive bacteria)]
MSTGEVERGQQSAVTSLWGPFKTYEEAAHAMDRTRERNDAWEKDGGWL